MKRNGMTKEEFKDYVKSKRGTRTHEEFAASLGVSKQAVGQYENGTSRPGDEVLRKLGLEKGFLFLK